MSKNSTDINRREFAKLASAVGLGASVGLAGCVGGDDEDGATYYFGLGSEMDTLDPQIDTSARGEVVFGSFSEPLFHFDPDGEIVPHLLADYEMLDGGERYVFEARDGVTFHNGEEFDGEVLAWNLERLFSSENPARATLGPEAEIEETGDMEVEIQFEDSYPILPAYLTYNTNTNTILSKSAFEEAGDDEWGVSEMVGSGPFVFEEWRRGEEIRLSRYDDYDWGPEFASNQGPSNFEELVIRIIPEETTLVSEVTDGNVNASNYVPPARLETIENHDDTSVNRIEGLSVISLPFNQTRELMQDINIRRAIAHAVDREAVISTAIGGEGFPAYDHVVETIPGAWSREEARERGITYDPDQAREYLEEAGWTNDEEGEVRTRDGEELNIMYRAVDIGHYEETAIVVAPMLEDVGFDVDIEINEIGTYWDMMEEGEYDIKTAEHWAVANQSDVLVDALHSDELTTPYGSVNYTNLQDDEVDELLDQARFHPDEDERLAAVREVQERYHDNVWYQPLYGFTRALCYENRLTGTDEFFDHDLWGDQYYLDKLVFDFEEE